jgi:hypothetical protein
VIHLLTLGAYAWEITTASDKLRDNGGLDIGSVFHDCVDAPDHQQWIEKTLLVDPKKLMCSDKYDGQETIIEFLNKLAEKGGSDHFEVQDKAIRAGAAWLCEYAIRYSSKAAAMIGTHSHSSKESAESDLQRRKREARERAMKQMQEKMANFVDIMKNDEDEEKNSQTSHIEDDSDAFNDDKICTPTFNEESDSSQVIESSIDADTHLPVNRLLQDRPQCIICGDDSNMCNEPNLQDDKTGKQTSSKVLAFCGFVQASVVLKGGGGVPSNDQNNTSALVGTHMSLCGHAVHTSCLASHFSNRENRSFDRLEGGKRAEFRCPLCRRLSNCLIPFIDVGKDWADCIDSPGKCHVKETEEECSFGSDNDIVRSSLHGFLESSKWWAIRNNKSVVWNGRCSFIPSHSAMHNIETDTENLLQKKQVKTFGKKDLYKAWSSVMSTPSFVRRGDSGLSDDSDSWRAFQADNSNTSAITEVWRKLLDHIADTSYKADVKRLGEERLFIDLGEFRHYIVEKIAFNEQNRLAGIGSSVVSVIFECIL